MQRIKIMNRQKTKPTSRATSAANCVAANKNRGKSQSDAYRAYADGSSLYNPGPAGWAVLIIKPDGTREMLVGSAALATNNAMELRAAIEALKAMPSNATGVLLSDSEYVVKGVTSWRKGWEAKGWRNAKGQPVANADYWRTVFQLSDQHPGIRFEWVRGHAGEEGNTLVDTLARAEAEKVRAGPPPVGPQEATHGLIRSGIGTAGGSATRRVASEADSARLKRAGA
ncbi:ribonuclease H family protein [Methylobacterium tarhaniae]|uniref:ribonuclease H family protein n=1 Tax=Methylobacterium tarhaniae TaxID=1187852 RepID=UPI0009FB05FE|nr:ribonuclease H [Methylobacterium tarhaniae]